MTTFARFFGVGTPLRGANLLTSLRGAKRRGNLLNRNIKTITYTNTKMNKNVFNYEAPEVKVVELYAEGVLCSSLTDGREGNFFDFEDGGDLF